MMQKVALFRALFNVEKLFFSVSVTLTEPEGKQYDTATLLNDPIRFAYFVL